MKESSIFDSPSHEKEQDERSNVHCMAHTPSWRMAPGGCPPTWRRRMRLSGQHSPTCLVSSEANCSLWVSSRLATNLRTRQPSGAEPGPGGVLTPGASAGAGRRISKSGEGGPSPSAAPSSPCLTPSPTAAAAAEACGGWKLKLPTERCGAPTPSPPVPPACTTAAARASPPKEPLPPALAASDSSPESSSPPLPLGDSGPRSAVAGPLACPPARSALSGEICREQGGVGAGVRSRSNKQKKTRPPAGWQRDQHRARCSPSMDLNLAPREAGAQAGRREWCRADHTTPWRAAQQELPPRLLTRVDFQ